MRQLIIFLFITISLDADIIWDKLLHIHDGDNQIVSNVFFLSKDINPTSQQELNSTINLLNSNDGETIACNFPARYIYLKNNNYNIPTYDLNKCTILNKFMNSFAKDKLSLVFTSEYTNNPSSAFGHIMLLFSDDNKSLNIGDAVHFAAQTSKNDGFFKYSYNGITGKYNAYFIREPFFKKIYEYNTLEQRYMYIYTLDFSKKQIKELLYHLFELRKATFKYYFLDGNCASETTDLLNIVTDKTRIDKTYYLPIDTIKSYQDYIINKTRYIPLINKLDLLLSNMTVDELSIFFNIIKDNEDVQNNYSDIVKEAMVYYSTFYFRRYHKIYKNYDNVLNQTYKKQIIKDGSLEPLKKTKPSHLGIGVYNQSNNTSLYIHYRPLFIDLFDIQENNIQQSAVDTFTWDFIINHDNLKLLKFDLLNIKSFTKQSSYYMPISWSLYSGLNRNNKSNNLVFNNEFGIGKTKFFKMINTSFLLYLGFDDSQIYIKPYLHINSYLTNNVKIGFNSYYKQYDGKYYYNNKIFISIKKDNFLYIITSENDNSTDNKKYLLSVKYNF